MLGFITQAYAQKSTRGTLGLLVPYEVGVRGGGYRTPCPPARNSVGERREHVFMPREKPFGLADQIGWLVIIVIIVVLFLAFRFLFSIALLPCLTTVSLPSCIDSTIRLFFFLSPIFHPALPPICFLREKNPPTTPHLFLSFPYLSTAVFRCCLSNKYFLHVQLHIELTHRNTHATHTRTHAHIKIVIRYLAACIDRTVLYQIGELQSSYEKTRSACEKPQ